MLAEYGVVEYGDLYQYGGEVLVVDVVTVSDHLGAIVSLRSESSGESFSLRSDYPPVALPPL